jgi:oligosaccharide repeat unit polymerase
VSTTHGFDRHIAKGSRVIIWYLLAVFITPLAGLWLMEGGEYGPSISRQGFPNGATWAFLLCWTLLASVAYFVATLGRAKGRGEVRLSALHDELFRHYAINLFFLDVVLVVVHLFVFGGIDVLTGKVGKGEFRTLLGSYGAIAFLLVKFAIPAMFAYAALLYRASRPSGWNATLLWANALVVVLYGVGWGTKSTPAAMIMPALLFLFWRPTLKQMAIIVVAVFGSFMILGFMFDVEKSAEMLDFVWTRITVLQGDVPWLAWENTVTGATMPSYGRTLLAVFGDHTLNTFLGLTVADYSRWVDYHYGLMVTEFSGTDLSRIEGGHNVTGTYFTEGLIAGGLAGVIAFSLIGGVIVGFVVRKISQARSANRSLAATLWGTYFCFCVFPWLNGGGITQFLHISTLVGMLVAGMLIRFLCAFHLSTAHLRTVPQPIPPRTVRAEREVP